MVIITAVAAIVGKVELIESEYKRTLAMMKIDLGRRDSRVARNLQIKWSWGCGDEVRGEVWGTRHSDPPTLTVPFLGYQQQI